MLFAGISMGIFLIIVILLGTWLVFNQKELKKKKMELVAAAERKNGSERLKNVKTIELFTPKQVHKITKDNSIPLGKGGFGEVYKGTLQDKTEVAVQASINVNKDTVDEFVREVEIQSGMMHMNILKLLGCCLQVDVPLLVYEYVAKGTLQDILHGKETDEQREPLALNSRLDIAIGSAQGLAYMHSFTQTGIQHADVKPSNILIDDKLVPKISDFGLSKMFKGGTEYTIDVRGHLDYMDPMSIIEKRLTPKGDVYNFGIVLLELICRKPVVYGGFRLLDEYKMVYEQDRSGRAMFDKDIANEEDIPILEEISMLAIKCLKLKAAERPAMVSVASALVMLKDSWEEKHN
jgi:serine/threonine protein kinase